MTNYVIYRLFDYEEGCYIGPEFDRLKDFFNYHICKTFQQDLRYDWRIMDFLSTERQYRFEYITKKGLVIEVHAPRKPGMFQNRYAIRDAYGKNYEEPQELYRISRVSNKFKGWRNYYDWDDGRITPPKNNINKLKRENWNWWFREFHTMNEHRQNEACIADHGEILVRGKRRRGNLPNTWDDLPNSSWHTRKSWKHNSKRKHQWKNK